MHLPTQPAQHMHAYFVLHARLQNKDALLFQYTHLVFFYSGVHVAGWLA